MAAESMHASQSTGTQAEAAAMQAMCQCGGEVCIVDARAHLVLETTRENQ